MGQLANGGGAANECHPQAPNGATDQHQDEISNGAPAEPLPQTAPSFKIKAQNPIPTPETRAGCLELPARDVGAPKLKCYRLDASPRPEDSVLSEHLQSAIDSILELQRLQGPSAGPARGTPGPPLDQAVTSILEGHL